MEQYEIIGIVALALVTLIGLFMTVYKPLNENTKAMTTLAVKVDQLTEQMKRQESDFISYKEHMTVSQQKQWDAINENSDKISEHGIEIGYLKGGK